MKYIKSTTGKAIEFAVTGTEKYRITPETPVQVTETGYAVIISRLGHQIETVLLESTGQATPQEAPETSSVKEASQETETEKELETETSTPSPETQPTVDGESSSEEEPQTV